jgi:hypothetical protein
MVYRLRDAQASSAVRQTDQAISDGTTEEEISTNLNEVNQEFVPSAKRMLVESNSGIIGDLAFTGFFLTGRRTHSWREHHGSSVGVSIVRTMRLCGAVARKNCSPFVARSPGEVKRRKGPEAPW